MESTHTLPLVRDDTLFGVCHALGEDFGFNPNYLRVTLGVLLIWNPVAVIGTYLALALAMTAMRLIVPNPRTAVEAESDEAEPTLHDGCEPRADNQEDREELAVAA